MAVNLAMRHLLKNHALSAVVALALALGMGEGAPTFAAVNAQPSTEHPAGSPAFSIQQQNETVWLLRPNRERLFSLGVCCVNQGASRTEFDAANPAYAAWQHYADSNVWASATVKRLKAWGFTTVGGWSDFHALRHCPAADM